ncbi:MAG: hypothetical protein IJS61_03295 [Firmicutes bacterium]|nr:hypothetical protein [Bacillota bacterium]
MKQKYTAPIIKTITIESENVLTVSSLQTQSVFSKFDPSKFGKLKEF